MKQLRALVLQCEDGAVCQVLELDIASQGKDVEEAALRILSTIRLRLELCSSEPNGATLAADLPKGPEWAHEGHRKLAQHVTDDSIRLADFLPRQVYEEMKEHFPYEEISFLALDLRS